MADLIVPPQLAEQIYAIAEQEQRSAEDILASMVNRYIALSDYDLSVLILKAAGVTPPSGEDSEPPLTEEEEQELADRIGRSGRPLSEIIIEERQQGY